MAKEVGEGGEIYRLTEHCNESFELWLNRTSRNGEEFLSFIDSQYRSFKAWTACSGALASVDLSLDNKLKDHDHLKLAVTELLNLALICLSDGKYLTTRA